MHTRLKHFLLFSNPCELGAHLLCFFNEAGLQHVLGTLGVDEAVSSVQGLSLVHPPSCFLDVAGVLQGRKQRKRQGECKYSRCQKFFLLYANLFILNLVDLGLDEEELNERWCAVDGSIDVLQSEAGLVCEVKVLRQEILYPQQGGRGLLLPIICTHI